MLQYLGKERIVQTALMGLQLRGAQNALERVKLQHLHQVVHMAKRNHTIIAIQVDVHIQEVVVIALI